MWKPFCDKNPCIDEYHGESVGLVYKEHVLLGLWRARHQKAYGLVLWNQAAGVWYDPEPQFGSFTDSLALLPTLFYLIKLAVLIAALYFLF